MCGGGGLPIFLSPFFEVDHRTPLYTTDEGTPNIPFIEAQQKTIPKHVLVFPILTNLGEISASSSKKSRTCSYLTDRPKLAEISARAIETPNMITEMGT